MSSPSPLHPAEILFDKYLDQGLTPGEQAQLDAWIAADPANAATLARWMLVHARMGEALADAGLDGADALDTTDAPDAAAQTAGRIAHKPSTAKLPVWIQFALVAACLALAAGAGAWLLLSPPPVKPVVAAHGVFKPPLALEPPVEPVSPPSEKTPQPHAIVAVANENKLPDSLSAPKIPFPSLETSVNSQNLQRLLLALALFNSPQVVAQDTPAAEPPALPPAASELPPPASIAESEAADNDPIGIPNLAAMTPSIQGCHKMLVRGEYGDALKRLDELKTKKLKDEELAAIAKMSDYAYDRGLVPQIKAIEDADPLAGLRMLNLFKPPNTPGPYAPKLKDRIAALEAKLRDPNMKALQDAGREFERIYLEYQAFPDEGKPKLESFVAAHGNDPYGNMAQRVLEGKLPVEETGLAVAGDPADGRELAAATLQYPSELGAAKGSVPKSQAELKKVCMEFLAQSEKVLRADTADAPECDAKFWQWVDAHPAIRTGLLLAKNPVPPSYAINLGKFRKQLGERACGKYGQLVLAAAFTEGDVTISGTGYARDDFSDNQRKVGTWLWKNQSKVPFWRYNQAPAKYADMAGGTMEGLNDGGKMAYASHTFPPRVNCSVMENVRQQIIQQETRVPGVRWPLFPVAQTPYILLSPVAQNTLSMREHDFVWGLFTGRVGYPGNAPAGEQPGPPAAPRVGTTIGYGKYGFEYTRPDVSQRRSQWHPSSVVRIIEDGGVCGRMATASSIGEVLLGIPSTPAGQPGHCALMTVGFDGRNYGASIGQSVTGTWMNTTPHMLGLSPAIAGHEGEAISWTTLTQTVNRVGMQNYHASLVAAYRAEACTDPAEKRNWLELAVRLNPYHLVAIEKIWAMAAQDGVNSLNKAIWETVERLALKKGKTMDDVVLGGPEHDILRKLAGTHIAAHYDAALNQAGNVSNEHKEYKLGDGYVPVEQTPEQKALAAKAGLAYDEKAQIKDDLNLMFKYFLAFQKKDLMYGTIQKIFLKHLSRVDPEIARKMLNDMLVEALKLPLPTNENMDENDTPLYVVITAILEMDSKLEPKDRARGLAELCSRIEKAGPRVVAHNHPALLYGTTLMVDDAQVQRVYQKAFDALNKTLREIGVAEAGMADKAEARLARDVAKKQYEFDLQTYKLAAGAYRSLLARAGGAKLNVKPPEYPKPPVLDKDGNLAKSGAAKKAAGDKTAAKPGGKKPVAVADGGADRPADSEDDRLRRGEGVKPE